MNTEIDADVRPSMKRLSYEIKLHEKMVENGILPSCISCEHFGGALMHKKDTPGLCHLYNARPPDRTIVFGCPSFVWDLPF